LTIGNRIKQRRQQLGLSQNDLADMLKITQNQIWRYEQGKNSPTGEVIIALAQALETSTDWLLGLTDIVKPFSGEPTLSDIEREIVMLMRSKSPESQQKLVEIARVV
jgi:transcriptional regulator with XRE-family HTH domain